MRCTTLERRALPGSGRCSTTHTIRPGNQSSTSSPPTIATQGTMESAATMSPRSSPRIEWNIPMPAGSATRYERKIPVMPRIFSRNLDAVTSTLLPLKRAAS